MQLSGDDANNYYLHGGTNSISGSNGAITVKQLIITSPTLATSKVYDSTNTATILQLGYLLGVADGDDLSINAIANYSDAAIGTNKTITVKYTITGADTGNYLKPVDYIDTTGEIKTPQSLSVTVDSLTLFTACAKDTTIAQSFSIAGNGLSGSVTITAPIGFELKDSLSSNYDNTLTIVPDTAGKLNTTVYARMKAQAISPANGNIIISTTGLADDSIAVRGVVNALPTVAATSGTSTVCIGSTTTLANTTAGGVWSSSNTSIATVSASGVVTGIAAGDATISYMVTNASGCANTLTKTITVNALPTVAAISGTATACVGSTTTLTNTTAGGVWSSSNASISTVNASGVVAGIAAGNATITYTVTNANGCVSAVTKTVTINALPIVTASINNAKADKGSNVVLSATGIGSFAWTPATNLLNPDKATTVARVLDNTTYTVTLTNASGCSSSASVLVEATDNMNFEAAYVFTPNGDGINDKFVIKNIEAYPDNKLMVYDRLGKPIYEANSYANNWDGKVNGFTLAKDTYFYVLSVKGQVVKRGAITLVR
jgi:gliding motility-associated-like protein